jgi:hypothetical protein
MADDDATSVQFVDNILSKCGIGIPSDYDNSVSGNETST